MKCLAIADLFITEEMMKTGLHQLVEKGFEVDIKTWKHDSLEDLQNDNIKLEKNGSEAVELPEYLVGNIEKYDYIITQFAPIGKKVIDQASKLKFIGVLRAGIENVNFEYANEKGVTVFNTPGRSETSVSEYTVGLILSEIRNITRSDRKLRSHQWEKYYPNGLLAPEIKESTIGLIGYGAIGQRVANLLRPFGGKIIFFDDFFNGEAEDQQVSLDELVQQADVISMHYRLTPQTKNMLNKKHFEQMKSSAVVINSARSGLINEVDLIEALQKNRITGAAIDVFDQEPLPNDHPYLSLENITITPHIAGSTIGNFANSPKILVDRIINEKL
ncbi:oxidoreductase [Tetragenococcus halophilus subsp. flandriensis]|uniref:2-hydroxyacid dehydrogenase n=1 Tax=Tetragenococcus halophilus TaxID=51669 RepID=UPI0023E9ED2D|nr:2-hydroxyacid dehydrogenase [Tetragenococcus halophilus]GMA09327.1 oxidoreductase [Tetragenococcus halophilus subsp. flandriensis]